VRAAFKRSLAQTRIPELTVFAKQPRPIVALSA